jgi:L-threonylcarbamoyladenylate synthase
MNGGTKFQTMQVRKVDPAHIDDAVIAEAAAIILQGGLVAFPTETVYGLGADATNAIAVTRIFTAKGRPSYNPLIVHASDVTGAARCVTSWPESAQTLVSRFWPGPLTIVLPKRPEIPDIVTAGLPTVGVRVPAHPVALALIRAAAVPIAAPSANRSMHVSPTVGDHVAASLGAAPDLILDAGPSSVGIESTVIDLSTPVPTVLRPGMISIDQLRALLGRVEMVKSNPADGSARASPGMMNRHYSPAARLVVSDAGAEAVTSAAAGKRSAGARVVVLARSAVAADSFAVWRMPDEPADYARLLYSMLHRADADGFEVVIVEDVPADSAWDGVRDRLRRASR